MHSARTLFTNAAFLTMDPAAPEAEALLVIAGRVERVGRIANLRAAAPDAAVVDLMGRTVLPGFIDAHNHFSLTALEPVSIDCRTPPNRTIADVLTRLEALVSRTPPGRWLRGHGYDDELLGRHPTRADLDSVAPEHPVVLAHVNLHRCVANSAALRLMNVHPAAGDPPGGWRVRDADGALTGVLYERAADRFQAASLIDYSAAFHAELPALFRANAARQHAQGITAIGDTYVNPSFQSVYRVAALNLTVRPFCGSRSGLLNPPVDCLASPPARFPWSSRGALPGRAVEADTITRQPPAATVRMLDSGVKIFLDGGGNTTAASLADGRPPRFLFYDADDLNALVGAAHGEGQPIAIHAAGDIAVSQALAAFDEARRQHPDLPPRFRIEHAITIKEPDIPRLRELDVAVVTQPEAIYQAGQRLGRAGLADGVLVSPYRAFLDAGVTLAFSSDSPCYVLSPLWQAWCAVTRATDGGGALEDGQAVTMMEALHAYTVAGAAAIFDPDGGALLPGRRADFVVLSHDPRRWPLDRWAELRVEQAYLGGEWVRLPEGAEAPPGRPYPASAQWHQPLA